MALGIQIPKEAKDALKDLENIKEGLDKMKLMIREQNMLLREQNDILRNLMWPKSEDYDTIGRDEKDEPKTEKEN